MRGDLVVPLGPTANAVADEGRLESLDSYDILDTPPEAGFDDIAQMAASVCGTPVALVSLVAEDRQWFKASVGFPACQTDLNISVCAYALAEPDLLIIPDLTADPRTRDNPLVVHEPRIRFYAGAPLRNERGYVLGSLCVIDTTPRPGGLTAQQADLLRNLGRQVMNLMELRRSVAGRDSVIARRRRVEQRIGQDHARLKISEAHWRGLFERLNEGLVIAEIVRDAADGAVDWRFLDVNAAWGVLTGLDFKSVAGRTVTEVFPGIGDEWVTGILPAQETSESTASIRQVEMLGRWYEGRAFTLDGDRFAILFVEVTDRIQSEARRTALLEIVDQLRDLTTPAEMITRASAIVGRALGVARVGLGQLDATGEHVEVEVDWTSAGMPSFAGRHRSADYGEIHHGLLLGEPLVIHDVLTDPRTAAHPAPLTDARIRSLVNIPMRGRGRTVAVFMVHDTKPRTWRPETVAFLRNVADRLTGGIDRLKAEAYQQTLNEELSHRMKNMLAMVQAIAMQTLKGVTEQDAVTAFRRRLQALASAHDVLLRKNWAASPLGEVVEAVLRQSSQMERIDFGGPYVELGSRATVSVSLLLHEMATNAVKHGALSNEGGRVAIAWEIDAERAELVLTWKETGGPPAVDPARGSFGTRLLRSGLLGTGGVDLRYLPTGLEVEMRALIGHLQSS